MLDITFKPKMPFHGFKWKWASLQCTEGINDPVVLLGVLFRMRKLERQGTKIKYSSNEFGAELAELSRDVSDSIGINLAGRKGERNLIRNSGQYWKALHLIPADSRSGVITLTDFGKRVADHDISQSEFAAVIIRTFTLPNSITQTPHEVEQWRKHGIEIHPLKLILEILQQLQKEKEDFISVEELVRIIIPLSGNKAELPDYVNFILAYRHDEIRISDWPDFIPDANDLRIAREYLLFLNNYGYITKIGDADRMSERYEYNHGLDAEIKEIISGGIPNETIQAALEAIRKTEAVSEVERKRVQNAQNRPNQARFRKCVLSAYERCVITHVAMPEVLEAAHIKPRKYKGEDTIANGFPMRVDVHVLFDSGHLRISDDGIVELSTRARMDYGAFPPRIVIPDTINREFLRWRWDNYNGI
ncbi:MAG: AlwI family type II restriction endonuclease [Clostridiales Family XIII bacterium]|nr:AlwI family type II restriction endonuclease [Clostridiales Family XIII bacterium]